jgi:hypothetical protein
MAQVRGMGKDLDPWKRKARKYRKMMWGKIRTGSRGS